MLLNRAVDSNLSFVLTPWENDQRDWMENMSIITFVNRKKKKSLSGPNQGFPEWPLQPTLCTFWQQRVIGSAPDDEQNTPLSIFAALSSPLLSVADGRRLLPFIP